MALAIHDAQIAQHGGGSGVPDMALLESALARPRNALGYAKADVAQLAALYALGILRNHPFMDGNKRVAATVLETFLEENGHALNASESEFLEAITAVAAGKISDARFIGWVRSRIDRTK